MDDEGVGTPRGRADPDSRARTHLANERTFLAWLRTGLNLIVLGMAVVQFVDVEIVPGVPLIALFGSGLVGSGILVTALSVARYQRGREQIDQGTFHAAGGTIVAAAALVGAAGLLALGLVLLLGGALW